MFNWFDDNDANWSFINSLIITCSEPIVGDCGEIDSLYTFENDATESNDINDISTDI